MNNGELCSNELSKYFFVLYFCLLSDVSKVVCGFCRSGRRSIVNDKELVDMLSKEVFVCDIYIYMSGTAEAGTGDEHVMSMNLT